MALSIAALFLSVVAVLIALLAWSQSSRAIGIAEHVDERVRRLPTPILRGKG